MPKSNYLPPSKRDTSQVTPEERNWLGLPTRASRRAANNLGIIKGSNTGKKFRSNKLEYLDSYYENRQYDHLPNWDCDEGSDAYTPVRKRKPRIRYAFAKTLCQRVAAKMVGEATFPRLVVEDDPDSEKFLAACVKAANLKSKLIEPVRRLLGAGAVFVRFYFVEGQPFVEHYLSKYCYPTFGSSGVLVFMRVQYVYEDPNELDEKGNPKQKWFRLDLSTDTDTLYDNPDYKADEEPVFQVVNSLVHGLGFVQGEWFKTCDYGKGVDGYSLIDDIDTFIDELCYSMSQSSAAIGYNQDPQLTLSGMDEDSIDELIRSSTKAWNLGREGKAEFAESTLNGVKQAQEMRDKVKQGITDVARFVMLDPEKFSAAAQSGKAMEVLHGPMVDLINELRSAFEKNYTNLVLKIALALLLFADSGVEIPINLPEGWKPASLDATVQWPPIFSPTIEDLQKKVAVAVSAANALLFSRETMMRWLAKDFAVEDIEGELAKIQAQPVNNPFGGF